MLIHFQTKSSNSYKEKVGKPQKTSYLIRKSLSHSFSSTPVNPLSSFLSEFCAQISSVTPVGDSAPPCSSAGSSFQSTD